MTAPPVVADTTVWSNFAHARQPRLVERAFPAVASPLAVVEEIAVGVRLGYLPDLDWSFVRRIELSDREVERARELETRLGVGEAASIAAASFRDGLVLTDDRAARRVARELGVPVSGTLGVLVRLVDAGHLGSRQANRLLARMIEAGYRSPVVSLSELL
jgi:hypothetical protein